VKVSPVVTYFITADFDFSLFVWTDEKYKGRSLFSFCHYLKYAGFFMITFTVVPSIIQEINCHHVTHRLWQP